MTHKGHDWSYCMYWGNENSNAIKGNHKNWRIIKYNFVFAIGDDHCEKPMLYVILQIGHSAKETRQSRDDTPWQPSPVTIARQTRRDNEKANDSEWQKCLAGNDRATECKLGYGGSRHGC